MTEVTDAADGSGTKYRGPSPSAQNGGGYYFDLEKLCGAWGLAGLAAKDKGTF
jgi:hypothetical protein